VNSTYWTESGLTPNTSNHRYAEAFNSAGSNISAADELWTLAAEPVFTGVSVGSFTVTLSWDGSGNSPVTRYALSRSTDNFVLNITTFITIADNFVSGTTVAADLWLNTSYWFRLWAYNNVGIATAIVSTGPVKTDKTTPLPPSAVSGSPTAVSSVLWTWTDAVYEDGYRILSSTDYSVLDTLSADTTFWLQTGLSPNSVYKICVEAWSSYNGFSSSSATALSPAYTYQTAPSTATAPVVSTNTATIYWTSLEGADYRVERDGVFLSSVTASASEASFYDTGLAPDGSYTYSVYSVNDAGQWDTLNGVTINVTAYNVFAVSGYLRDIDGAVIQGLTVSLSGDAFADCVTGGNGFYAFIGLASGDYSVTISSSPYIFNPVSYSTSSLSANISGWDFTVLVVPDIIPGKPGFVSMDYPLIFDGVVKIEIYSPGGAKAVEINGNAWYGTENNSRPSSSSQMMESGAYIYKTRSASGQKKYGTVIIVK